MLSFMAEIYYCFKKLNKIVKKCVALDDKDKDYLYMYPSLFDFAFCFIIITHKIAAFLNRWNFQSYLIRKKSNRCKFNRQTIIYYC